MLPATIDHVQRNQPPGVPPLELTGERTLPDVPEENYWFRRHLAVYEWIAERVGGLRVADLACGEGYGADGPRADGRRGGGGGRKPGGPRARPAALPARKPALRARPGGGVRGAVRRDRLPADDRARLRARSGCWSASPPPRRSPTSRRPTGSRSPRPAPRSPTTPGTCASTRSPSTARSWSPTSRGSRCSASSTPASCASTSWRCGSAGTASTARFASRSPSTTASSRRSRLRLQGHPEGDLDSALDFLAVCHA